MNIYQINTVVCDAYYIETGDNISNVLTVLEDYSVSKFIKCFYYQSTFGEDATKVYVYVNKERIVSVYPYKEEE